MRATIAGLAVVAASAALAQAPAESQQDRDRAECGRAGEAAGNEAVRQAKLRHPGDVTKIKADARRKAVSACLASKGLAVGKIREK